MKFPEKSSLEDGFVLNVKNDSYFHSVGCGLLGMFRFPTSVVKMVLPCLVTIANAMIDAVMFLLTVTFVHFVWLPALGFSGRLDTVSRHVNSQINKAGGK